MIGYNEYMDMLSVVRKAGSDELFRHSVSAEKEAARLAIRYKADVDKARIAGLLHDITKETEIDLQLRLCEEYGIMTDKLERSQRRLIHSKTAAAIIEKKLGINDPEIVNAVRFHTTGTENMTLLMKIIYLADVIEPFRDYDGVDILRKLAYEDIDKAMIFSLDSTIESVKKRGLELHGETLKARQWFYSEKR